MRTSASGPFPWLIGGFALLVVVGYFGNLMPRHQSVRVAGADSTPRAACQTRGAVLDGKHGLE
jgi:hypothetical protein